MFGLRVLRHRWFECEPSILFSPKTCGHIGYATGNRNRRVMGITKTPTLENTGSNYVTVAGNNYLAEEGRMAMGIDWTTKAELSQAIPPAYTEWIGRQMLELIR
jgi:DNA (cytosine-5)-methyltransferase 1